MNRPPYTFDHLGLSPFWTGFMEGLHVGNWWYIIRAAITGKDTP